MRKVPELRFDGFDGEWEEKKLSKIAKFSKGKGYSKNDLSNGKYPIYLYGQMYTNYKSQINEIETYTDSIKVNSILSKGNEVLIPSSGETAEDLARASHMNISNVLLGGDLNIIEPIDGVNSHFLALELSNGSVKRSLSKKAQGKSVVHLYNSDIKNQKINYTKFEEQEKIGDLFKKIDDLIEIQETRIAKMEDFKKSMLQKMFPKKGELVPEFRFYGFDGEWKNVYVKDIGSFLGGTSIESYFNKKGDYKVISIGSYSNNSKYIDQGLRVDLNDKTKSKLLSRNDLAMVLNDKTTQGNIIGRALLIDEDSKYIFNQRTQRITPNFDKYNSLFLYYLFNSDIFRNKIKKISQGNTQIYVNWPNVESILLKVPKKEEQAKIGQFFKNLDTQIENEEKLLDSYKMMKKSLLQKMFV